MFSELYGNTELIIRGLEILVRNQIKLVAGISLGGPRSNASVEESRQDRWG